MVHTCWTRVTNAEWFANGACAHTSSRKFCRFGTPELRSLWKHAGDLSLAVQLHFEPRYAPGFEPLIREFPRTTVIIDHLGRIGADGEIRRADVEALCALAKHPRLYIKVGAFYALGKKNARKALADAAEAIRSRTGRK